MDLILVKIFATALTLSQVTTQPQAIKTQFDPAKDQDEVVQILRERLRAYEASVRYRIDQSRRSDRDRA